MDCNEGVRGGSTKTEERGEALVYMWGYLPGVSSEKSPTLSLTPVQFPNRMDGGDSWKDVCGGGCGFAMAISECGKLMTWGSTDDEGQSYVVSGKHGETPEPYRLPNEASILKAAAGWAHCVSVTAPTDGGGGKVKTIEEMYQKKSQLEHILLRPDTYIGSIEKHTSNLWVYQNGEMVNRSITYVPGLYKIFDEILVNAADNKQRDPSMDSVKVTIDVEQNCISVYNNGAGVPVEIHQEERVYVPELIFGHLLTSSNYDDTVKKTTGGYFRV